ncbi:hypothetical protein GCM10022381_07350 [Leifsonia kafniensis]|uniref:Lipoprotein LpqB N-terminal domain-containing protein n=1 Tax=Leifsonia kafniensis TaxID=475957 RepID=A0ABP7K617_9MICO
MTTSKTTHDRTLGVILAVIAGLVIVAVAVVLSRGEPKLLDAATPPGVVQRYSAALIDGDETAAQQYLTPAVREQCDRLDSVYTDNLRVALVSTTERADSADVKVSLITSSEGGLFGPSEYETAEKFSLAKIDGAWLIDTTPWQLTICSNAAGS